MSRQFLILCLPRSRSTWLSKFLSYSDWYCGHDEVQYTRQIEDIQSWLSQDNTGTVETAVAPFWRLALHFKPDLKIVTIRRDPIEAAHSAIKAGLGTDLEATIELFKKLDRKLGQIERRTGCMSIKYEDLQKESTCKELFEYVLPYKHDSARWSELNEENVQIDTQALNRYVSVYKVQLGRLYAIARQKSFSILASKRVRDIPGLTLNFEPLQDLLRDGDPAMRDHCVQVGEHPDSFSTKNLPLFQKYEDVGGLQVTVARSNGRVFGYLVSTIGESLEVPGRTWACHTAFYASPDYPGLGLKLQRKAAEGLRDKGVYEVAMRAGTRGSGDRVSALYTRIGAEPFGTYYRLQLGEF